MKCFYHKGDLDGICSGAIVKYKYPDCEMFGIEYGDEFPWNKMIKDEKVFICDFSMPMDDMNKLSRKVLLIWIDHHKSAIDAYNCIDDAFYEVSLEVGISACELTWGYLDDYKNTPRAVYLLGRYDVWDHRDQRILPFQYAMRSLVTNGVDDPLWVRLFNEEEDLFKIIDKGESILSYESQQNKLKMSTLSSVIQFENLRVLTINTWGGSSTIYKSKWDPDKHDIMMAYVRYPSGKWTVSLRGDGRFDVSEIAKKYGGGGHKNAAGFVCKELPFEI